MKVFNYKLPEAVTGLGDFHYGAGNCKVPEIKETIKKIKKNNYSTVLMGDLMENSTKTSVGAGVYEQDYNPRDQIENLCKLLDPISHNILFMISGNHEFRSFKDSGIDVSKVIADYLECDYTPYMGLARLKGTKQKYDLFAWHGATGAATVQGKLRPLMQKAEWIDADVYLQGHVHELYHVAEIKRTIVKNNFKDNFKHFVLTGSYLGYDETYAEMKGYKPCKIGSPLIKFNPLKHEIGVDLEW